MPDSLENDSKQATCYFRIRRFGIWLSPLPSCPFFAASGFIDINLTVCTNIKMQVTRIKTYLLALWWVIERQTWFIYWCAIKRSKRGWNKFGKLFNAEQSALFFISTHLNTILSRILHRRRSLRRDNSPSLPGKSQFPRGLSAVLSHKNRPPMPDPKIWCQIATHITTNTLVIDVKLPRNILLNSITPIRHGNMRLKNVAFVNLEKTI
jgi:hypothetical protein